MQMSRRRSPIRKAARRALSLLLVLAMAFGALPFLETPAAKAASWTQPYLDQMVEWGVMRGDESGNLNPDRNMTRAEFVAMINRALGYTETGAMPFTDVSPRDWYYDDINIAFNAGYFKGTSATTASPNSPLTREQAVVILGRTMMYRTRPGEVLEFTDSHSFQDWSKGYIREACLMNVIGGYPDGSFRPGKNITRGEVAAVLQRAVGTLIRDQGEVELGDVYGAVTIRTSGVTLKNTVIAGDLFITGGVGLGSVVLENVTVLGRIIVSGGGESHEGGNSVVLRNVMAGEMVVDNMANQFVTLRAEGDTIIGLTNVRAPAYLEDVTQDGYGLQRIELDGEAGTNVTLAGNIKEVVNFCPSSLLTFAQGVARKVTIDEKATGSSVLIEEGANVKEMNLDVGTIVTGGGDIGSLNVNAPGCSTEMLPDTITIRPGITADIAGETMNSAQAVESSQDPRLLAGYPVAKNVAPTSADGVYSTNKQATVYWAITALADGSVNEDDLVNPPATGKIIRSGNTAAAASNTEYSNRFTGLISDGSYYISAVAVDNRGQRSPVKVAAFTTPDNTVPNFAAGYPSMLQIRKDSGQVQLMPTKSCQLYYAIFPKGSTAPTVMDFKTGSLEGNLGNGVRDVTKNVLEFVTFGNLQEVTSYDVYLCLIDADQNLNSAVRRLNFTTIDGTPPVFTQDPPLTTSIQVNSVGLETALNENGTIYWVAVKQGETYPTRMAGQTEPPALDSIAAKIQVENGSGNVVSSGTLNGVRANQPAKLNINRLQGQTGYDVYYVAKDTAGNYSDKVKKITIHTLDTVPPTATQEFTRTSDEEGTEPLADTNIRVIFDEAVQDSESGEIFYDLYQQIKNATGTEKDRLKVRLGELLRDNITLWDASSFPDKQVPVIKTGEAKPVGHWVNYDEVTIEMKDGKVICTFAYDEAVKLGSGNTYYFKLTNIADTSNNANVIRPNPTNLPKFTTVFAEVNLEGQGIAENDGPVDVRVDMSFAIHPTSTANVENTVSYDIYLWSTSNIEFDVYARLKVKDAKGNEVVDPMAEGLTADAHGWAKLGTFTHTTENGRKVGQSVGKANNKYPRLSSLKEDCTYEYVISINRIGTLTDWTTWSEEVTIDVGVPAGLSHVMSNWANSITEDNWNRALGLGLTGNGLVPVGDPKDFNVFCQFADTRVPQFDIPYPRFVEGDTFVTMDLMLDRPGTVYYALAPVDDPQTGRPVLGTVPSNNVGFKDWFDGLPADGTTLDPDEEQVSSPTSQFIFQGRFGNQRIKAGKVEVDTTVISERVEGLEASKDYVAYFVLKGEAQELSRVYCLKFKTGEAITPDIDLENASPSVIVDTFTTTSDGIKDITSEGYWILYARDKLDSAFTRAFKELIPTDKMTDFNNICGSGKTFPDDSKVLVIDALMTNYPGTNQSVFDRCIDPERASRYLEIIRVNTTTDLNENGELVRGTTRRVTCTKMQPGTSYYFIAAAKNVQGSVYAYKAISGITQPDRTPPEVESMTPTVDPYVKKLEPSDDATTAANMGKYIVPIASSKADPEAYVYKGQVSVRFSKPVYVLLDGGELTALDSAEIVKHWGTTGTYLGIKPVRVGREITFSYTGATEGSTVTFFTDGLISDANNNTQNKKLKLTFHLKKNGGMAGSAYTDPYWELTWE